MLQPQDLNFPAHYTSFRPAQIEAFDHGLTSDKRFIAIGAPPGVGKSGIAWGFAKLFGGTTRILTSNKGLQDQYAYGKFPGLVDIRGRSNYDCWEGGSCEDGARLDCKDHAGCPYKQKLAVFNNTEVGLSNYSWWLAVNARRNGTRMPDTLICDEAHLIFDWLSQALDFYITERECRDAGERLTPIPGENIQTWTARAAVIVQAATVAHADAKESLSHSRTESNKARLRKAENFLERAEKLFILEPGNWVCTLDEGTDYGRLWRFECVWPYKYKEWIFQYIERIILMSATLRPKTLSLLGISKSDTDFREWPRQFPLIRGPVIWLKTARVRGKMKPEEESTWLHRIAEIIQWGSDRKGLIHSVSYPRARQITEFLIGQGVQSHRLRVNGAADPESQTARQAYLAFVASGPGTVLISPSFSTGWDFARKVAEWQIIAKLPLVDTRSKVMAARQDDDRNYPHYLAAQALQQSCGRINRDENDRGMTIIVDDSWQWFKACAEGYLCNWFKVRPETQLPPPLPLLEY